MASKTPPIYDFGIVGGGISGMQLALSMIGDPHFDNSTIMIIEKDLKDTYDKTLCFWEEGVGQWDDLITHTWSNAKFINIDGKVTSLNLGDYQYKMLPSVNFYNFALGKLKNDKRVIWVIDKVDSVKEDNSGITISTEADNYQVNQCFDSRVTVDYHSIASQSAMVMQPFIGLEIEFEHSVIDTESFTMMDYQFRSEDNTAFFYILPLSNKKALVEYTLFVPNPSKDMNSYLSHIDAYIKAQISDHPYQIRHKEIGAIPMTDYPFHKVNTNRLTKIGTAGSWVRPSTGYAFKYIEHYVSKVIANLKAGRKPSHQLFKKRHQMMDTLLLDLLQKENRIGPTLFNTMYAKVPVTRIFKFLDGKTSLLEDIKIMNAFEYKPFFRAIRRQWL